jgi:cell division cycle 20-like protein 1 (cofactor of APC complex)
VPYKVLDAPDLADDFYLNLVDWSSNDVMGVGLGQSVYLWSAKTSEVTTLCDLGKTSDKVTGINWAPRGNHLAIGTNDGLVQIWDAEHLKLIRTMRGHVNRVGALAWNEHILSTASRDRSILHRDVRVPAQSIAELKGHKQEVCGLKWNSITNQLASGGNDNTLFVWDGLTTVPLYRFTQHKAAIKALAWSPHQNGLLATGAGTQDMHIRFFNTITGNLISEVDTGSQVCNLAWSMINNELISTHGFSGGKVSNQVQVWKYPDMSQVATLMGHTKRVLYLAMSPDGESFVSGAGDETLRFWDIGNSPRTLPQRLLTNAHRLR